MYWKYKIYKAAFIGLLFFLMTLSQSCVEPIDLMKNSDKDFTVVFDGVVVNNTDFQTIKLSKSVNAYGEDEYPLKNATVSIEDDMGDVFQFFENDTASGTYNGIISRAYMTVGSKFRLHFSLDDGREYQSDFEEITPCPPVDSVYYEVKNDTQFVNTTNEVKTGVQFYVDIKADDNYSRFYRWKLNETYEYHSTWPVTSYWIGHMVTHAKPDSSRVICYKTEDIPEIFTTSTKQLDENLFLRYPLQFVSNGNQRLYYRYSLLVTQMSLTEKGYYYWELLKENLNGSSLLTDKQPSQIFGNIHCVSNPDEKVLGYFGASDVKQKRIFVQNVEGLTFGQIFCVPFLLDPRFLVYPIPEDWPYYFVKKPQGAEDGLYIGDHYCFDCLLRGGTLEVPDIWKENK